MKKTTIILSITTILALGLSSCSGCVKKISKKTTELGIEAVEGVVEAVDEHGERIGQKTTDAAGKVAVGVGRSLEKQLDEHASHVASVAGKTTVQTIDGFVGGFNEEVDTHYDKLPYTEDFVSGVALDYFAKYKNSPVVDSYFIMPEGGSYKVKYDCYDNSDKLFMSKTIDVISVGQRKYTLVSFALNGSEEASFANLKNVKITVNKK